MTPKQKALRDREFDIEIERATARESLLAFGLYIRKEFQAFYHTKIVTSELEEWAFGDRLRLVLTVGPQYGKSSWSSILLPAYILGRNPDARILLLSYGASLSSDFNSEVQKIMDSEAYRQLFPGTVLNKENVRTQSDKPRRNSDIIEIPGHSGAFVNAGIGGAYTGKGFNYIILDDLIKSREEADSPTYREQTDAAYTDTIKTRRANDKAKILILNTRWHLDDLTGRRLRAAQRNALIDQWKVVNLPALLSDCKDQEAERWKFPTGQEPGKEVLWPEHFSWKDVVSSKTENPFNFSAQYMGTPIAREGNVIKRAWFPTNPLFDYKKEHRPACLYFDIGGSSQPTADRTVGTVEAQIPGGDYPKTMLLHQMSGQWDGDKRDDEMEKYSVAVNEFFPGIPIYLENTFGLAKDVAPAIQRRLLSKGLNVQLDTVRTPKFARAEPFLSSARAGRVELYEGTLFESLGFPNWQEEFLDELTQLQQRETPRGPEFFNGHDDRLDSPAGAFNKLTQPVQPDYFSRN